MPVKILHLNLLRPRKSEIHTKKIVVLLILTKDTKIGEGQPGKPSEYHPCSYYCLPVVAASSKACSLDIGAELDRMTWAIWLAIGVMIFVQISS